MQLSSAPAKLTEAWAAGGSKNYPIPLPSQIPFTPGAASWTDGFPPLTMTPIASGGVPPSGLDCNGALYTLSAIDLWYCCGAGFPYDSVFSAAIGGYPKGSRVLAATGNGYWLSIADNNTTDPDTGGAGWIIQGVNGMSSVYASANQTLAVGNAKVLFATVEFDNGLWDATNQRFDCPYPGKYRISGSVLLYQPAPQDLATWIWHNHTPVKQCCQFPQVSDINLSLPFDAVINCAVNDYLEVYMVIPSTPVQAGNGGNWNQYVFAQCTYLGT